MEWLKIIIPSIVTLIGLYVNYRTLKRNFSNEIEKFQITKNLDNLNKTTFDILELLNEVQSLKGKKAPQNTLEKYSSVLSQIYAYGSDNAIRLMTLIQSSSYKRLKEGSGNSFEALALYPLLISQIRFDLTSDVISPKYWFIMKLTDYENYKDEIMNINNKAVRDLSLNEAFIIKEMSI